MDKSKSYGKSIAHDVHSAFLRLDLFGKPLPVFMLRGKEEIRTSLGALLSVGLTVILFLFALLKLSHLVERKNPLVNTFELMNEIGPDGRFLPHESQFAMAVAVQNFVTTEYKSDPKFVKWAAYYYTATDGIWTNRYLPITPC